MNTPNVHAGRLERRVRLVGGETMPGIHGICSFYPFGAIRGVLLLSLTALLRSMALVFFWVFYNNLWRIKQSNQKCDNHKKARNPYWPVCGPVSLNAPS